MATQIQWRRGTTAEHSTFTGAVGELTVDTTKDVVVVHDGVTAGGIPMAKESSVLPVNTQTTAASAKTTPVDADLVPLVDSADSNSLKKLSWTNIKATLKTYFDTLYQAAGSYLTASDIGTTVQGYDVDTAKLDVDQSWTGSQRGTITTDNDGSFDLNVTNNFKCTPTGGFTLTFTNITAGQSGFILLVNGSNYAIAAHTNTKVGTSTLTTISATGTYLLSYFSDGTNVYVVNSGALA